jgi:hypothetical protein
MRRRLTVCTAFPERVFPRHRRGAGASMCVGGVTKTYAGGILPDRLGSEGSSAATLSLSTIAAPQYRCPPPPKITNGKTHESKQAPCKTCSAAGCACHRSESRSSSDRPSDPGPGAATCRRQRSESTARAFADQRTRARTGSEVRNRSELLAASPAAIERLRGSIGDVSRSLLSLSNRNEGNPFRVLQPSGTTLTTSSGVVNPWAIFIAPDTRSGFMPSL